MHICKQKINKQPKTVSGNNYNKKQTKMAAVAITTDIQFAFKGRTHLRRIILRLNKRTDGTDAP